MSEGNKGTVDLRSDTVTQPTTEMRQAMANAELGDDVYGEDPTINRLEELSAELLGKQSSLFIPSGTMGNLAAILTHCGRGDEIILGTQAHTFLYEAGGISALGGIHPRTVPNQEDGTILLEDIEASIRPDDPHCPITRLITIENTHNRCGGTYLTKTYTKSVRELAQRYNLHLHLDGARIFNAAVAQGIDAKDLVEDTDSVTFCLSKSLCAPVGSVLCGNEDFIHGARRIRKQLGGGMRQAGVLAAAGIVALENMIDRLADDHDRANRLATRLRDLPWIKLMKNPPPTNMVFLDIAEDSPLNAFEIAERLRREGVLVGSVGERRMRLVIHYWIDDKGVERVVDAFRKILNGTKGENP